MKTIIGIIAIIFSSQAFALEPGQSLTCKETRSSDKANKHRLYHERIVLENVGFDKFGELYVATNSSEIEKKRDYLLVQEDGFSFAGDFFAKTEEGVYRGELEQSNGSPIYGTFITYHQVTCKLIPLASL